MDKLIEGLCQDAEREQEEGNNRVAELLWSIAEDLEDQNAKVLEAADELADALGGLDALTARQAAIVEAALAAYRKARGKE